MSRLIFPMIIIWGLVLSPLTAKAEMAIEAAAGYQSNYGLVGVGFRYFINESIDLHVNAGADMTGFMSGIGTRVYSSPISEKCYFFIPCKAKLFGGLFWAKTNGGDVEVTENGSVSEYNQTNGNFLSLSGGAFDLFGGWFFTSVEVGYRYFYNRPDVTYKSGPNIQSQLDDLEEYSESGVFASIAIGVQF